MSLEVVGWIVRPGAPIQFHGRFMSYDQLPDEHPLDGSLGLMSTMPDKVATEASL